MEREGKMNKEIDEFLITCDELINCKFLVAEYKLAKMLKALASAQDVCNLVGECLEQFNRDREFAKAYQEDNKGNFYCVMPEEEYKIIALVFCTLVDIDGKKIDFTDFVMRFFGREKNPYEAFVQTMIVPFKNLIEEAFCGQQGQSEEGQPCDECEECDCDDCHCEDDEDAETHDDGDRFALAERVAVQILSELQFLKQDYNAEMATMIAKAIVKTSQMKDDEITASLISAFKVYKVKSIRFMVRELFDAFGL